MVPLVISRSLEAVSVILESKAGVRLVESDVCFDDIDLGGYSYWYQSMDHTTSIFKLVPKGRARAPFNSSDTNISLNVRTAQDFEQYLQLVVGSGIHDDSCPLNHQLRQSSKISNRRHKFDFVIR
ncbi:hypothetical protein RCL1_008139 [Eukaryota sp. TZLM3-RCL]